jgi:hypothetical protein
MFIGDREVLSHFFKEKNLIIMVISPKMWYKYFALIENIVNFILGEQSWTELFYLFV